MDPFAAAAQTVVKLVCAVGEPLVRIGELSRAQLELSELVANLPNDRGVLRQRGEQVIRTAVTLVLTHSLSNVEGAILIEQGKDRRHGGRDAVGELSCSGGCLVAAVGNLSRAV